MQPIKDWNQVRPVGGESRKLPAGGYVCKIVGAKEEVSRAGNAMLVIALDIAEGEYAGFFREKYNGQKWPNQAILRILEPDGNKDDPDTYSRKAGRIKKFIQDVEKSNDPYVFKWDESTLRGKTVGGLFGEEEFETQDGRTAWATKIFFTTTASNIREEKFSIPNQRPLNNSITTSPAYVSTAPAEEFVEIADMDSDDGLPF